MTIRNLSDTEAYLENRFSLTGDGVYRPHQPIFGLGAAGEKGQLIRLARTYRLIRWITALNPESVIDLGAAEGYIANLVRLSTNAKAMVVDLSYEACLRAAEIYQLGGISTDISSIPIKDDSADVVVLSEVFEHLENPIQVLSEGLRIAKRYLVLTTQELCNSGIEQNLRIAVRNLKEAHTELNMVCLQDLKRITNAPVELAPQFRRSLIRSTSDLPALRWRDHIKWLSDVPSFRQGEGVIMVISVSGERIPSLPKVGSDDLLDMLINGPPKARSEPVPWEWLTGIDPPSDGELTVNASDYSRDSTIRHPLINEEYCLYFLKLISREREVSRRLKQRCGLRLKWMERIGHLTSTDPFSVKLNWLMRRPLVKA